MIQTTIIPKTANYDDATINLNASSELQVKETFSGLRVVEHGSGATLQLQENRRHVLQAGVADTFTDAHGVTLSSGGVTSGSGGIEFKTKIALSGLVVTKHASSGASRCRLFSSTGVLLATQSFVGNDATFTYGLSANTTYRLDADANGGNYTIYQNLSPGVPPSVSGLFVDFTGGSTGGSATTGFYNVVSVSVTGDAVTVTLPAICSLGSVVEIVNPTQLYVEISQNANQKIIDEDGNASTVGVSGKALTTTACLVLVCTKANDFFTVTKNYNPVGVN